MKFKVGELVVKKQLSKEVMYVIDNNDLTCQWIENGKYKTSVFSESDVISLSDWIILSLKLR